MLPLALNAILPQSMRIKYQLAIGAFPIGFVFASLVPLFLLVPWLGTALGLSPGIPVKAQSNGILWFVIIISALILGMVSGYFFGWVINTAIARTCLTGRLRRCGKSFWTRGCRRTGSRTARPRMRVLMPRARR